MAVEGGDLCYVANGGHAFICLSFSYSWFVDSFCLFDQEKFARQARAPDALLRAARGRSHSVPAGETEKERESCHTVAAAATAACRVLFSPH